MSYLFICLAATTASALTFFSGFGLGTLLLPVFALFVPIDRAVAFTAIVHLINSVFKLLLVGSHADRKTVLRFGLPAILAAVLGAALLQGDVISDVLLLVVVVVAACGGALIGARVLTKATFTTVQRIVAAMLIAVTIGLVMGVM